MKSADGKKWKRILWVGGILTVFFQGQANADELIFKYHDRFLKKINSRDSSAEVEIESRAWKKAREIVSSYIKTEELKRPVTLIVQTAYLDYNRKIKGIYNPGINIVIATDYSVLVHEYLHALFYLAGMPGLSSDEDFIRSIWNPAN